MPWDADTEGNVIWRPIKAFHIAPVAETIVMARIECSPTPQELPSTAAAVQVGMTPRQALQLAEDLRKTAEHVLSLKSAGKPNRSLGSSCSARDASGAAS